MYATDKQGNKFELAYFFNDLKNHELSQLTRSMNSFELAILTDDEFRNQIKSKLKE